MTVSRVTSNQRRQPAAWTHRSRNAPLGLSRMKSQLGPFGVGERVRVLRVGDPGLAAVAELDLVAWPAPRAGDQQHQWATPAAPCSSMSAPDSNRASAYGRASSCGSPVATVAAITQPDAGVALNPPVPQPQLR